MNTLFRLLAQDRGHGATLTARSVMLATLGAGMALAQETQGIQYPNIGDLDSFYNREVLWMSIPAIILSILVFIGTSWALFYSVVKFRERKGDNREPAQFHGNHTLEIFLIGVPMVIVTILAILTVRTMARLNDPQQYAASVGGQPVRTDVLAAQFWWNFTYPNLGEIANGNEHIIPAGRPVEIEITARDVIHQYWAPNIGGQRTALPGVRNLYSVSIDKPGVYQGNCTQLCGASHANMRYKVIALEQNDWNTFVAAARAYRAPEPDTDSERRGYQVFMQGKNGAPSCASCHRVQGTPANGVAGPDLSYFGTRRTLGAGMWEGEEARDKLGPWILNSPALKPGSLMPAYIAKNNGEERRLLSEQDIEDLEAYMLSLKLPEEADYWRMVLGR